MDISAALRLKGAWDKFTAGHPQFPLFLRALRERNIFCEGTVIDITVEAPGQNPIHSKMRLSAEDMELFSEAMSIVRGQGQ